MSGSEASTVSYSTPKQKFRELDQNGVMYIEQAGTLIKSVTLTMVLEFLTSYIRDT